MSADDNLSTVKGIYDAFGSGDVPAILDQLADDVDWAADAAGDAAPWWGERKGKDAVVGFFESLGGAVDVLTFEPVGFAANDDDEVMVLLRFASKSKQTGRESSMNIHHYWHFRDGKVDRYRGSEDTAQTAVMLGGSSG
jgi:ketosteroid isomerase-like protein